MKTIIYYFTGTGNSLKVAKDIAAGLGDTDIKPISKSIGDILNNDYTSIGIIFPVYAWGAPRIVEKFLKNLQVKQNKYFFSVATCAGSAGGTLFQVEKQLRLKKQRLSLGFVVKMPSNYIVMSDADTEEKQQKLFKAEQRKIKEIISAVREKEVKPIKNIPVYIRIFTYLVYKISLFIFRKMGKKFYADQNCSSCSICVRLCPVGNIEMKNKKPVWKNDCEQCLACIQWCPEKSVQFGKGTLSRTRYHHPDIKVSELM